MKLSLTIGTNDAYRDALVVFRGLDENLKTISELGYDGIELALFSKKNVNVAKLKRQLKDYGLELPVISTGQIFTMQRSWFTHPDRTVREKAVDVFKEIIEVAAEFGSKVNISRVRGYIHDGDTYEEAIERLSTCLYEVCQFASKYNLTIVLEQMNRYETNYMNSASSVGDFIRKAKIPNLKLHADVFHMNIEDESIIGSLEEYKDVLGYIHFADSNRLAPGCGHIDFPQIINALNFIGYEDWIGIEVLTKPNAFLAAKKSIEYLRKLF